MLGLSEHSSDVLSSASAELQSFRSLPTEVVRVLRVTKPLGIFTSCIQRDRRKARIQAVALEQAWMAVLPDTSVSFIPAQLARHKASTAVRQVPRSCFSALLKVTTFRVSIAVMLRALEK